MVQYCRHRPFAKQQAFLDLRCLEALYGGAAGPGKTDALLMSALQYVHVPGYAALILRRDYPRLSLPGSIMERARQWLTGTDAVAQDSGKLWRFPSGAVLQFGYIDNPADRFRYASSEFQFIGWDELTEFRLGSDESNPYLFMFSRLRRPSAGPLAEVPLRMRAATNPGNEGHAWVKRRFITDDALQSLRDGQPRVFFADSDHQRAFVPALMQDNPFLDRERYLEGLSHLPPVTRERLVSGDWAVREDSLIRPEWLCYYSMRGEMIVLKMRDGKEIAFHQRECTRFGTADTAGTSEDKAKEKKGKPPSWSVIGIWDRAPARYGKKLILRDVWRKRVEFTDLLQGFRDMYGRWHCKIKVENKHVGPAVHSMLRGSVQTELIESGTEKGKVERAAPLMNMLERGEIFLPEHDNDWRPTLEAEWLGWTGQPEETDDQVDIASYAALDQFKSGGVWGGVVTAR